MISRAVRPAERKYISLSPKLSCTISPPPKKAILSSLNAAPPPQSRTTDSTVRVTNNFLHDTIWHTATLPVNGNGARPYIPCERKKKHYTFIKSI
jgi:hypothetical protein